MYKLEKILTEARDSLTQETWHKGNYFKTKNDRLCMCSHGAVQALVNPLCKKSVSLKLSMTARPAEAAARYAASRTRAAFAATWAARAMASTLADKLSLQVNWNNRPDWVKDNDQYGSKDAHYLLGMVGLTASFNDYPNTTLEMVKEKFNEAIQLANYLQV